LLDNLLSSAGLAGILPLGDNAYEQGRLAEYQAYYGPAWGRAELLSITHPVPGNHEYDGSDADGYFDYFGGRAGTRGQGYYSYDVPGWHLVALNSNTGCARIPCGDGSAQLTWLVADLASHPSPCTLAYWHHPRFGAGTTYGDVQA